MKSKLTKVFEICIFSKLTKEAICKELIKKVYKNICSFENKRKFNQIQNQPLFILGKSAEFATDDVAITKTINKNNFQNSCF